MNNGPILVPFGPTHEVPKGHRWCFACDGSGEDSLEDSKPCKVCNGKGHWNADDIRKYHEQYPNVCQSSCGERHVAPSFWSLSDFKKLDDALERAREILEKHEGK